MTFSKFPIVPMQHLISVYAASASMECKILFYPRNFSLFTKRSVMNQTDSQSYDSEKPMRLAQSIGKYPE